MGINGVAWSRDGNGIATVGGSGNVYLFNTHDGSMAHMTWIGSEAKCPPGLPTAKSAVGTLYLTKFITAGGDLLATL